MPKIAVSVIMPSLNVVRYIDECLRSVLNQTLENIEIICVDAGSTDGTLEIIKKYAALDRRIRVVESAKRSYGYQLNIGVKVASGEFIGIVETDDYILKSMYQRLYLIAKRYDVEFIKSSFYRFNGNKKERYCITKGKKEYEHRVIDVTKEKETFFFPMNTWSGIYKRDFLNKYNIRHNESLGASFQDNGFWFQTFVYGRRAYFLDEAYYMNRRDNPNSSVYDLKKVFTICDEYKFIRDMLESDYHLFSKYKGIYTYHCFVNYEIVFKRILCKDRAAFLNRFIYDFHEFEKRGMISMKIFEEHNANLGEHLKLLLQNPDEYCSLLFM